MPFVQVPSIEGSVSKSCSLAWGGREDGEDVLRGRVDVVIEGVGVSEAVIFVIFGRLAPPISANPPPGIDGLGEAVVLGKSEREYG